MDEKIEPGHSVSDVVRGLKRLRFKRTDSKLVLEMWEAVGETKMEEKGFASDVQLGLNLSTILSKGVKWFTVHRIKARARLLFDLYEKTLQIKNYGNLINNVFKTDVSRLSKDTVIVKRIAATVDRLAAVDRTARWGQRLLERPRSAL